MSKENENTFGPNYDNRVKGELLVKLKQEAEMQVSENIPSGPIAKITSELPTAFGTTSLDKILLGLKVKSISRVHNPASSAFASEFAVSMDEQPGIVKKKAVQTTLERIASEMNATYRLRLEPTEDIEKARNKLSKDESIAEISTNYFRFALEAYAPATPTYPWIQCAPSPYYIQCPPGAWVISSVIPNDPQYAQQWGLQKINCPTAWAKTKGSTSVTVAVVDTGVDLNHPDLVANLVAGYDCVDLVGVSPKTGWRWEGDYLSRDNVPQDEVGHGTHVAGTIAASTNNSVGVAGVTWNCKIMPVKVLARMVKISTGAVTGSGTASDIAFGIRYAADNGAHIINLSLGGYNNTFVERDAVAYAIGKGCSVVAAMGNDNTATPSYPAAYPDVVAVGAIDQSEKRANPATHGWGSNTGPHIDVVAPGVNILSTVWNDTYSYKSGTSMATPHVSGVAALMKSCNMSLTNTQIAQILHNTAKNLKDNPADPIPNNQYGYGLINAQAAVNAACPTIQPCPIAPYYQVCPPSPYQPICPPSPYQPLCPPSPYITCPPAPYQIQCPPSPAQVGCLAGPDPLKFDPNRIINPVVNPVAKETAKTTTVKKAKKKTT